MGASFAWNVAKANPLDNHYTAVTNVDMSQLTQRTHHVFAQNAEITLMNRTLRNKLSGKILTIFDFMVWHSTTYVAV